MTLDLPAIRARAEAALPMDLYEAGKALGMAHMDRAALLAEVERLREAGGISRDRVKCMLLWIVREVRPYMSNEDEDKIIAECFAAFDGEATRG